MILVRSAVFNLLFLAWTLLLALTLWPALLLPRRATVAVYHLWRAGIDLLLRRVAGIGQRWIGFDGLPPGPVIFAAKHQSAWDTIEMPHRFGDAAVVIKRELLWLPVYGWLAARYGVIPVDRSAGSAALRRMLTRARHATAAGRSILIFPQGTRVAPGGPARPYHPGVAALYAHLGLPVVPVAVDSGLCWGRRAFVKRPGTITVELLPAIPPGLDRRRFLQRLEADTEAATERLVATATSARPAPS